MVTCLLLRTKVFSRLIREVLGDDHDSEGFLEGSCAVWSRVGLPRLRHILERGVEWCWWGGCGHDPSDWVVLLLPMGCGFLLYFIVFSVRLGCTWTRCSIVTMPMELMKENLKILFKPSARLICLAPDFWLFWLFSIQSAQNSADTQI